MNVNMIKMNSANTLATLAGAVAGEPSRALDIAALVRRLDHPRGISNALIHFYHACRHAASAAELEAARAELEAARAELEAARAAWAAEEADEPEAKGHLAHMWEADVLPAFGALDDAEFAVRNLKNARDEVVHWAKAFVG